VQPSKCTALTRCVVVQGVQPSKCTAIDLVCGGGAGCTAQQVYSIDLVCVVVQGVQPKMQVHSIDLVCGGAGCAAKQVHGIDLVCVVVQGVQPSMCTALTWCEVLARAQRAVQRRHSIDLLCMLVVRAQHRLGVSGGGGAGTACGEAAQGTHQEYRERQQSRLRVQREKVQTQLQDFVGRRG
jgi:hypothetical protein